MQLGQVRFGDFVERRRVERGSVRHRLCRQRRSEALHETWQRDTLARTMYAGMRGKDLLGQCCAGSRQPDDEDRSPIGAGRNWPGMKPGTIV